ncbi:MAG: competence protein ComEC [Parcubacteria group bacterium Gr01-1014_30]|nr:MAG: competence protein ComEC [Parcubacteria group bacterium Gr01-1014_30]
MAAAALGVFLISVFWNRKESVVLGFCVLLLLAGVWRYQLAELQVMNDELRMLKDREENITLVGAVSGEPDLRERSQRLTVKVGDSKVLVTTWRYPEYQYGDELKITGKLESPPTFAELRSSRRQGEAGDETKPQRPSHAHRSARAFDDFNYRDYLKKEGVYSVMTFPKIEVVAKNQGNFFYAKILQFKEKLRASLYQNLSPPQSAILGAMLLADNRQLSEDLKNKLNVTSLRHVIAISGLHVTVLSAMMMSFLLWLGFWRQHAFWLSIILITLYIIMTGLQPSAVRAGIMGGLFLTAQYLGRQNTSSRAIFIAAALMLFHNPFLLRLDLGFQLSFLAMLGIIYLLSTFEDWLKFIPWGNPRSIVAMTLAAYFWTLPVLVYNFGIVSLVSPLANLAVVPFLYLIMLFGFLFGLAGMVFQSFGWILSWPAWLLLIYLTTAVDLFSKLPLAYVTLQNVHWLWLIIPYALLALITWRLQERQRLKFLRY